MTNEEGKECRMALKNCPLCEGGGLEWRDVTYNMAVVPCRCKSWVDTDQQDYKMMSVEVKGQIADIQGTEKNRMALKRLRGSIIQEYSSFEVRDQRMKREKDIQTFLKKD